VPKRLTVKLIYSEGRSLKCPSNHVDMNWNELQRDTVQPRDIAVPLIQNSSLEFINNFELRIAEHVGCICLLIEEYN